jgi:hypothetical protein
MCTLLFQKSLPGKNYTTTVLCTEKATIINQCLDTFLKSSHTVNLAKTPLSSKDMSVKLTQTG